MLHVAIIGGGYICECHIAAYKGMTPQLAAVTAIVDVNEASGKAMAEKAGCAWYKTLEEAASNEVIDIVDICVPTFLHESFTVAAAGMGKHVLCEKPITLTLESFDTMESACREAGVRFMTAQVLRYEAAYAETSRRIHTLGNIHMLSAKRLCQHPTWTAWHRDPQRSGGGLFDLNAHDIDFIYSLFGLPESVTSVGWKSPTGCWNHIAQVLRWRDKQAVCEVSLEMTGDYPFTADLRVVGDGGTVEYCSKAGVNIKDAETTETYFCYPADGPIEAVSLSSNDPFRRMIEEFLRAVAENREVPILPSQSRDVLRILDASKRSLETGETVYL